MGIAIYLRATSRRPSSTTCRVSCRRRSRQQGIRFLFVCMFLFLFCIPKTRSCSFQSKAVMIDGDFFFPLLTLVACLRTSTKRVMMLSQQIWVTLSFSRGSSMVRLCCFPLYISDFVVLRFICQSSSFSTLYARFCHSPPYMPGFVVLRLMYQALSFSALYTRLRRSPPYMPGFVILRLMCQALSFSALYVRLRCSLPYISGFAAQPKSTVARG